MSRRTIAVVFCVALLVPFGTRSATPSRAHRFQTGSTGASVLSADGAALRARLSRIAGSIELGRNRTADALERDEPVPACLADAAAEDLAALDDLAAAAFTLPPPERDLLRSKIESVRLLAANLAAVTRSGIGDGQFPGPLVQRPRASRRIAAPTEGPANDNCGDAAAIGLETVIGSTTEATPDGSAQCGASTGTADVWFRFVAPHEGWFTFVTAGSDFDTVLSLETACPGAPDAHEVACNDDLLGLQSGVSVSAAAGQALLVRVSGAAGASGSYMLTVGEGGRVSGSVTDAATGLPIAGTTVLAALPPSGWAAASTTTAADGTYVLPSLAGAIYVVATADEDDGYVDQLFDGVACFGGLGRGCTADQGTPLDLRMPGTAVVADFTLDRAGSVAGTAHDALSGDALAVPYQVDIFNATGFPNVVTRSAGESWLAPEVAPGTHFALLSAPGYQSELFEDVNCIGCDPTDGTPIMVAAGATTAGIAFSPAPLASLSGQVTDAATALPLAGVTVTARAVGGGSESSVVSNASGAYVINGLSAGTYAVLARTYCYVDTLYPDLPCEGGFGVGCAVDDSAGVVVSLEEPGVDAVDFALAPSGVISGTVRSAATGEPLAGVRLEAWRQIYSIPEDEAVTDSAGAYTLQCLGAGAYEVLITDAVDFVEELYDDVPCPGGFTHGCSRSDATWIDTSLVEPTRGIDFALDRGGALAGRVVEEGTGRALAGVRVEAWRNNTPVKWATTGAYGGYTISGLPPGEFSVGSDETATHMGALYDGIPCPGGPGSGCAPDLGTPVAVTPGQLTTGIRLVMPRKGTVTGHVTAGDSGEGLASVRIALWNEVGEEVASAYSRGYGVYTIDGLPTGRYYATAAVFPPLPYLSQLYAAKPCGLGPPAGCPVTGGTPVDVRLGRTTEGVDFVLQRGGSVRGAVRDPVTGEGLAVLPVSIWDAVRQIRRITSWSDGGYELTGLPTGTYFLSVLPSSLRIGQIFSGLDCLDTLSCNPREGTPVQVTAGETVAGVDFAPKAKGTVRGVVSHQGSGEPVGSVRIELRDEAGNWVTSTSSYASGGYQFSFLQPGTYRASTSSTEWIDELFREIPCLGPSGDCPFELGAPVTVQAGEETRHVDFTLSHRADVSGEVTYALDGRPASSARVFLLAGDGTELARATVSSDGTYHLWALPGTGYLAARAPSSSYAPELYDAVPCAAGAVTDCFTDATPVTLAADDEIPGIDFALKRLGLISGTVTRRGTGEAVSARVELYDATTGELVSISQTYSGYGTFSFDALPWGTYSLLARSYTGAFVSQLYADVSCPDGIPEGCQPGDGTPVAVTQVSPLQQQIDFHVDLVGAVRGTIRDAATGSPLPASVALVTPTGEGVAMAYGDSFDFGGLEPGTYVALAWRDGYTAQLYDGVECGRTDPASCDLASGLPLTVDINRVISGVDFALHRSTVPVDALVTSAHTGKPIARTYVTFYDNAAAAVTNCVTDMTGGCTIWINPGTWFVKAAVASYVPELFDDIPCPGTCDVTKGNPFTVTSDGSVSVSFTLERDGPTLIGRVASAGAPVPYTIIDGWNADTGLWVDSAMADENGVFVLDVPAGRYHLSTDNGQGLIDEVFDDVLCPAGPAIDGLCDPAAGTAVTVVDAPVTGLDFELLAPSDILFLDGFEDGLGGWSLVVGN